MKTAAIFFSIFFCFGINFAYGFDRNNWLQTPQDELKAIENDKTAPTRTMPKKILSPLPKKMEGTVRSVKLPQDKKAVALTFDFCELARLTSGCNMKIINFLREEKIPATFFMGGKWMRTHKERVKQIMFEPLFEIGNHAWTHGNFGILDKKGMAEQVYYTQAQYELLRKEAILERKAEAPKVELEYLPPEVPTLFRLPYGRCNDDALAFLAKCGLQTIQWSIVAETEKDNAKPRLAERVVDEIKSGDIVLFHANMVPKHTEVLVKNVVNLLRKEGYSFVSVGNLLKMGDPKRTKNGYFSYPGDNLSLDKKFGKYGTGE